LLLATICSNDGTKIYSNNDPAGTLPTTTYKQLGKIVKLEGCHITDIGAPPTSTSPTPSPDTLYGRPNTPYTYAPFGTDAHFNRINSDSGDTARFPFSAQNYVFRKTIMFAPSGETYITGQLSSAGATGYVVVPILEIAVQTTHGSSVDTNSSNLVAVQVTGMTSAVKI